jgi:TonB family protein
LRDNVLAANELSLLYAEDGAKWRDLALAHAYAVFASDRMERWPEKLPDHLRADPDALRKKLSKAQLDRSANKLAEIRSSANKFHAHLENSISRRVLATPRSELTPGVSVLFWQADHTGECFDNLVGNCTGVPQTIGVRVINGTPEQLICEAHADLPEFAGEALKSRTMILVPPKSDRSGTLGISQARIPATGAFRAQCGPVTLDAKNVCRPRMTGDARADASHRGLSGTAVVRGLIIPGGKLPVDADVLTSSGNPALDAAAMRVLRSRTFENPCEDKIAVATVTVTFSAR